MTAKAAEQKPPETAWDSDPDVELMKKVRAGDAQSFRQLFSKYSHALVNFTFRFVGNRERAEELAQDTFLQIFRARKRYEARAKFATYLYRVATNLCLNELRRFDYQGKLEPLEGTPGDEEEEAFREFADERLPSSEEHVAGLETSARIDKALRALPPNQKSALLLSRVEGFSYQEVAECLETSESAVKSLIFRATQTLRERLKDLVREKHSDDK
ncbi:MAG: RNA polymerase sigma factor [Candidatus Binatia bacterium]